MLNMIVCGAIIASFNGSWEIKMHASQVSTEVHGKSNIFQDAEVKDSTIHPLLTCGIWKGIIHLHALHYVHNV